MSTSTMWPRLPAGSASPVGRRAQRGDRTVATFRAVAEQVVAAGARAVAIESAPRAAPIPHDGYRPFDAAGTAAAFPDFRLHALAKGWRRPSGRSAE